MDCQSSPQVPIMTASSTASASSPSPSQMLEDVPLSPPVGSTLPPLPPSSKRKSSTSNSQRSDVWEHFTKYEIEGEIFNKDGTKEKNIQKRAKCKYCPKGQGDYAADPSANGTSNLLKHIEFQCRHYPGRKPDKRQKTLSFDETGGGLTARGATKEDCLSACVQMVIIDELPFSFVEGQGFRVFCSVACPYFQVPSRRTLVRFFLTMYQETKLKLKNDLASRRVCLTTDTWTSCQNINYMVITAHFIDDDWNLHKRVLNFCVIANHKGNSIGKLLEQCLYDWGVEKVLTISADNASTNKVAIDYLKTKMRNWEHSNMVLEGKYMHVRCCAHIINLIVGEGLKKLEKSILAIRNVVKYVRSSPQRLEYFKNCVAAEKIECKGLVVLDVPTRWNSTYLMLSAALKFEKAFTRMEEDDDNAYLGWFGEDEEGEEDLDTATATTPAPSKASKAKKRVGPPKAQDWSNANVFVSFLKVFYDMTLKVSLTIHPAVHETFHDLISIEAEINVLFQGENVMFVDEEDDDNAEARRVLNNMAEAIRVKFAKYWGNLDNINAFLMVALVLDPRFKLGNLAHVLESYCIDVAYANRKTRKIMAILVKLFDEYVIPVDDASSGSNASGVTSNESSSSMDTSKEPRGGEKEA